MSEIEFELKTPIWQVEFYHTHPNTVGFWCIAVQAEDQDTAISMALDEFKKHGLDPFRIYKSIVTELEFLKGGENGN